MSLCLKVPIATHEHLILVTLMIRWVLLDNTFPVVLANLLNIGTIYQYSLRSALECRSGSLVP